MSTINSLHDYMQFIEAECDPEDILFRGQECDWTPRPKIARDDMHLKIADRLVAERSMFEQFRREARPYLDQPLDDWELLALARHAGLPTRLMDWTKNPLAALWFAVQDVPKTDRPGVVLVWWFDQKRCCEPKGSPFEVPETFIYRPSHIHTRITAQRGWFTIHPFVNGDYQRVGNMLHGERFRKLEIPSQRFADIRKHLDRCGFNSASMYPDLVGVAQHVQWLHTLLKDEEPLSTSRSAR